MPIPESTKEYGLSLSKDMRVFGTPIDELTRDELIAMVAILDARAQKAEEDYANTARLRAVAFLKGRT